MSPQPPDGAPALEAESLVVGYRGRAVGGPFDLAIRPGELVAITGRSGSGKSTLLFTLGQLLAPLSGLVRSFGSVLSTARDAELSRWRATMVGFLFQDALLDTSRTILDSITEAALYRGQDPRQLRGRARELLEEMGVEAPVDRRPGEISGGQAQRVALCRALLGEPKLILADEPTGNLDRDTTRLILEALRRRAAAGTAIIVVTHSVDVLDEADRAIALSELNAR